jgi:hypothetical protein
VRRISVCSPMFLRLNSEFHPGSCSGILSHTGAARVVDTTRLRDLQSDLAAAGKGVQVASCPVHGEPMVLREKKNNPQGLMGEMSQEPVSLFQDVTRNHPTCVLMYVRFPLSLRNVEDLLHERGIDICHETVRHWVDRFGTHFAHKIRKRRSERMRQSPQWQWHLDEVFVKIRGKTHYLWRAVDHEGEVLESFVTKDSRQGFSVEIHEKSHETVRQSPSRRDGQMPLLSRGYERDWKCRASGVRPASQQSR